MDIYSAGFIISMVIFIIGSVLILVKKKPVSANKTSTPSSSATQTLPLQLQAYERLSLLADRIALPNLIVRLNQSGISAREMQLLYIQAIRQEFEYNITQQIYVSAESWEAVKTLKDNTQLIIHQFANELPEDAGSADLNKLLLEYVMNDPKGNLHELVSNAISEEARKLL